MMTISIINKASVIHFSSRRQNIYAGNPMKAPVRIFIKLIRVFVPPDRRKHYKKLPGRHFRQRR